MTRVVISQPMYFPWPGFFEQMRLADVYVWLDDVQFSKGSFTNRVQVLVEGKQVWMTVPLAKKTGRDIANLEARGDEWRASHRALLTQSLRQAEHLETALDVFDLALARTPLVDLLIASAEGCGEALSALPPRIVKSSDLGVGGRGSDRVLDIVRHLDGTRYLTGHGAARYLDAGVFEAAGVEVEFMDYHVVPWPQRGGPFTPYVTALDLLAMRGPEAPGHLQPRTVPWRAFIEHYAETP